LLDQEEFELKMSKNWASALSSIIRCWRLNGEENRIDIERSAYSLALWHGAALLEMGRGYSFEFDTLQHSAFVFVSDADSPASPLQRGRCAFYGPAMSETLTLTWMDSSLAPISGGFLLAAQ